MNRLLTAAALALALSAPIAAHAMEPLIAKLAEVDDAVKSVAPQFACYDQTDPMTCQQMRTAHTSIGTFYTGDFPDGHRNRCFEPGFNLHYSVCTGKGKTWAEIYNGTHWTTAPLSDPRCDQWGGPFTAEYLACEAALPPKNA